MTTAFNYTKKYSRPARKENETAGVSLFSPLALLILLALVFTFFITASNEPAYLRVQDTEAQNSPSVAPDPVVIYQKVVTNADAIRSVLQ